MIGDDVATVRHLEPIFAAFAPDLESEPRTRGRENVGGSAEHGYLHCDPSGAGHFVKMVHNGIEYGAMEAYAERFNILHPAKVGRHKQGVDAEATPLLHPEHYAYDLNLADIAKFWRQPVRPVEYFPRAQPNVLAVPKGDEAIAIEFDFVQPAAACRRGGNLLGKPDVNAVRKLSRRRALWECESPPLHQNNLRQTLEGCTIPSRRLSTALLARLSVLMCCRGFNVGSGALQNSFTGVAKKKKRIKASEVLARKMMERSC